MASRNVTGRIRKQKIQQVLPATSKQGLARAQKTLAAVLLLLALGAVTLVRPYLAAAKDKHKKKDSAESSAAAATGKTAPNTLIGLPATDLTSDEAISHALNRLGFGPRPGDVDRVKQMGLAKWIDRQLHPESIDDSTLDARLQRFPTLKMSSETLLTKFPRPQIAARREGVTPEEYRKQQQEKLQAARQAADGSEQGPAQQQMARGGQQAGIQQGSGQANAQDDSAVNMPGMPASGGKGANVPENGAGNFPATANGPANSPANSMMNYEQLQTPQRIIAELSMAKIDRAIYSERQLDEQMADFWFNHFNVFAGKGQDRWLLTSYERDAIRPHAMGKFRDLLESTAKSPAMLFYLDNWQSVDPQAFKRMQQEQEARRGMRGAFGRGRFGFPAGMPGPNAQGQAQAKKNQDRGLNENYGRELMELHTLGVDAGYTQQDVLEVAKCFTGWTIRTPQRAPEFWFDERLHDPNPKTVLGHRINGGGIKDGEEVLDLLARDPHTAHHLSFEIAQYFVADNPPAALVDRMAQTYLQTDGDMRAVLHTMIYSPEFWSREAYRAKIKTPFEVVVSAARAVGADVEIPLQLVQWTGRIGEPLYQCQPPTGYSDKAEAWVNTGALLNRMNYSLALTSNRLRGVTVDVATLLGSGGTNTLNDTGTAKATGVANAAGAANAPEQPREKLDRAIAVLLSGEVSPETRKTLETQMSNPQVLRASLDDPVTQVNDGLIAGLVLGSPEFQRR
jgi:uncharacterized protein (DUF1800 family)